nr:hypothetical protein JVH1_0761 [Rhodococcus sp. JVH1]
MVLRLVPTPRQSCHHTLDGGRRGQRTIVHFWDRRDCGINEEFLVPKSQDRIGDRRASALAVRVACG